MVAGNAENIHTQLPVKWANYAKEKEANRTKRKNLIKSKEFGFVKDTRLHTHTGSTAQERASEQRDKI